MIPAKVLGTFGAAKIIHWVCTGAPTLPALRHVPMGPCPWAQIGEFRNGKEFFHTIFLTHFFFFANFFREPTFFPSEVTWGTSPAETATRACWTHPRGIKWLVCACCILTFNIPFFKINFGLSLILLLDKSAKFLARIMRPSRNKLVNNQILQVLCRRSDSNLIKNLMPRVYFRKFKERISLATNPRSRESAEISAIYL